MSRRVSFENRRLVIQILPNPYIEVGPWDLALDRNGFLFNGRNRYFGWIKGSGWHGKRRSVDGGWS